MTVPEPKGPCRFFRSQDGCRFGKKCRFSHDLSPTLGTKTPPQSPQRNVPSSPTLTTPRTRSARTGNGAPKNACDFYWSTGQCDRGFECTFRHQKNPGPQTSGADASDGVEDREDDANAALGFFTVENLTQMAGVGLTSTQEGTPENAHNAIKRYLGGGSLSDPSDMKPLTSILASVNSRNRSWTVDSAQEFLDMIIRRDELPSRIGDILTFPGVSPRAATNSTLLSFQLDYFPVLEFFASDLILKSTLRHNINALYAVLYEHWETVSATIESSMQSMVLNRIWNDATPGLADNLQGRLTGATVFKTLSELVIQVFHRFKTALERYPHLNEFVEHLAEWFGVWETGVQSQPPTFSNPVTSNQETCQLTVQTLRKTVERLRTIIEREHRATESKLVVTKKVPSKTERNQALVMILEQTYDPPGALRPEGPRHNNDYTFIANIRICPTSGELMCRLPPYLPVTVPGAPHHFPEGSIERHLDIQFRLLREDLMFPVREALRVLQEDLDDMWTQSYGKKREPAELERILEKGGGLYRSFGKGSVIFNVYTDVDYAGLSVGPQGFCVQLSIRCPPGPGRDPDMRKRRDYWLNAGSKRLTSGSLVALVLVSGGSTRAHLANLVSSAEEIADSAIKSAGYIRVNATFFDRQVEIEALGKQKITTGMDTFALLIDNGGMFESVRPFLKTLGGVDSSSIPFSRYICTRDSLSNIEVHPPRYATAPRFQFKLQSVAKPGQRINPLDVTDPASVAHARNQLRESSVLDPSQADSVVDALTREISLIQGPPGTGKSYTGKELFRILLDNKIKPIVLIAFTNHALDHMLNSILDAAITKRVVRLGSRSTDERIEKYSLRNLDQAHPDRSMKRQIGKEYAGKKKAEESMRRAMDRIQIPYPSEVQIKGYLQRAWGEHLSHMYDPPLWIAEYADQWWGPEDDEGEWIEVRGKGNKGRGGQRFMTHSYYDLWKRGLDITFIHPPQAQYEVSPSSRKEWKTYQKRMFKFFKELGYDRSEIPPPVPTGNRPLAQLQNSPDVWEMSLEERQQLAAYWEDEMRQLAYHDYLGSFEGCRMSYEDACERYEAVTDERKRRLLAGVDLIGCTTTGAAKLTSLLTNIQPRVLFVSRLFPAGAHPYNQVQHLICIGDPKQLRPNLATYSLSVDSNRGKELFKFDRSLMERLSDEGFPMSQINVQRRMRPTISHHIRTILYPKLEDNEIVKHYPDVKGMGENVLFFTHCHKEDDGQESVSKVNSFEVNMAVELVMYLLRQGEYNDPGDVAVLCAYLGQLQRVRLALRSLKVTVAVDERDEEQLVKQGLEDEDEDQDQDQDEARLTEEVAVVQHVRLGTVDNFQGQEAKVVIVSLVRNSGEFNTENVQIGFLKSENRINVALSRAKHGLYVMGNASNLRKNPTWTTILDEMEKKGQIGFGFPIVCARHPDRAKIISEPGQLPEVAPLGGCLLPCGFKLSCGHICPLLCHADLDNHQSILCYENCVRLACIRQHPCVKRCHQPCGNCEFSFSNVTLPCGHVEEQVSCYQLDNLASVECRKIVEKKLVHCEHSKTVACYEDPASVTCTEPCNQVMNCCSSKKCKGRCGDCQVQSSNAGEVPSGLIPREIHADHPCERVLYCRHRCGRPCHPEDQGCNSNCKQSCCQRCIHQKCPEPCSVACTPCLETCPWRCDHHECPVACGLICARLPCDEPCAELLPCDHPCPSVCGEPCEVQKCVWCMDEGANDLIVDLISQRTISDIDTTSDDVRERLIALGCGHIFTVESLDRHCSMSEYYEVDPETGNYLGMKAPPIQYQKPPVCPTCKDPITSPRYGRVTKRANLDILEQNVASDMSSRLEKCRSSVEAIAADFKSWETAAVGGIGDRGGDFASEDNFVRICEKRRDLFGPPDEPLPPTMLREVKKFHGFAGREAQQWIEVTKEALRTYRALTLITSTHPVHAKAYEAAMMKIIAEEPSKADGETQREATCAATNDRTGQSLYGVDRKYRIEAFLLTIELRLMLARIASARASASPPSFGDRIHSRHRQIWITFVGFLRDSCIKDCAKTISLARSCSAFRQEARASVVNLRCTFEKVKFDTLEGRSDTEGPVTIGDSQFNAGEGLGDFISRRKAEAEKGFAQTKARHFQNLQASSQERIGEEDTWFRENCASEAKRIFVEYDNLWQQVLKAVKKPARERRDVIDSFESYLGSDVADCEW